MAALTTPSIPPECSASRAAALMNSSRLLTSATTLSTRAPCAARDSVASIQVEASISTRPTTAPDRARSSADARPSPRPAPVTKITRPVKSNGITTSTGKVTTPPDELGSRCLHWQLIGDTIDPAIRRYRMSRASARGGCMVQDEIEVRPLSGAGGAEVRGVDLSRELDARAWQIVQSAFLDHIAL